MCTGVGSSTSEMNCIFCLCTLLSVPCIFTSAISSLSHQDVPVGDGIHLRHVLYFSFPFIKIRIVKRNKLRIERLALRRLLRKPCLIVLLQALLISFVFSVVLVVVLSDMVAACHTCSSDEHSCSACSCIRIVEQAARLLLHAVFLQELLYTSAFEDTSFRNRLSLSGCSAEFAVESFAELSVVVFVRSLVRSSHSQKHSSRRDGAVSEPIRIKKRFLLNSIFLWLLYLLRLLLLFLTVTEHFRRRALVYLTELLTRCRSSLRSLDGVDLHGMHKMSQAPGSSAENCTSANDLCKQVRCLSRCS